MIAMWQSLQQTSLWRSKPRGQLIGARRRRQVEYLEDRELLSGQPPLITDAAPFTEAYINAVYRDTLKSINRKLK